MTSIADVSRFAKLFRGNEGAYGVFTPARGKTEAGKAKGSCRTVSEPVSPDLYDEHLEGTLSLGIVPINTAGKCYFGAIDIDDYTGLHWIPKFLQRYNIPLIPVRSKSGGLHLYCFLKDALEAKTLVGYLHQFRSILGLPENTEVFPKQTRLSEGVGNWINIPYYGKSSRRAVTADGKELSFEEFLAHAEALLSTEKSLLGVLDALPLSSAPPCLQAMYLTGEIGRANSGRNIFLFNAGVYLRTRFGVDELPARLKALNATLPNSLSESELEKTVIRTHTKRTYQYQCGESLLKKFCCVDICSKREFGKSSTYYTNLNYGALTQFMYDPPYYEWDINGKIMRFMSESELLDQNKFIEQCVRYMHVAPRKMKNEKWHDVLSAALSNVIVVIPKDFDVVTENASVWEAMREFFEERVQAKKMDDILRGLVYTVPEGKVFHFPMLIKYLDSRRIQIQTRKLSLMLNSIGVTEYQATMKSGRSYRAKCLPLGAEISPAFALAKANAEAVIETPSSGAAAGNGGGINKGVPVPRLAQKHSPEPSNPIDALRAAVDNLTDEDY